MAPSEATVLARSVDLLHPDDRRAWYLVAALPSVGASTDDVATGLDEPAARAERRLFRLRDANLVRFDAARMRYAMHPLARQYARTRAASEGAWDRALASAAKGA